MSNLELHQLTHPELLSEETLCEVLENRCIDIPKLKTLNKSELVEIYMRVALPLPQRQYEGKRRLGKRTQHLHTNNSGTAVSEESVKTEVSTVNKSKIELSNKCNGIIQTSQDNKSKRSIDAVNPSSKKICLSNTSKMMTASKSSDEMEKVSTPTVAKRQKITWP